MECHNDTGKCLRRPKCAYACDLRVQPVLTRPSTPIGWSDTDWLKLLAEARREGWNECMDEWANHMRRMNRALTPNV